MRAIGHALVITGSMTWAITWALILGFTLSAIVQAAGGRFTDLDGAPITLESNSVLATNGPLHPLILQALDASAQFPQRI